MVSERTSNRDLYISSKPSLFQTFPYISSTKSENDYSLLTTKYFSKPFRMTYTSFVEEGKQMMSIIFISIFGEDGK